MIICIMILILVGVAVFAGFSIFSKKAKPATEISLKFSSLK